MNTSKRPHPRTYSRAQVERMMKRKICRIQMLEAQLEAAQAAIREMVSHNRRVEQTWRDGVAKKPALTA